MDRKQPVMIGEVESLARGFFTAEELSEIQVKIDAHQESIDYEMATYGKAEDASPLDWYTAFRDTLDSAESYAKEDASARKYLKRCLAFEILLGVMQPVAEEDAREAARCGINIGMRSFPKIGKQRYEFVAHPIGWK
jgi:hypothetical protein